MHRFFRLIVTSLMALAVIGTGGVLAQENPDGFPQPELVVVPGTLQDELGCAGEWQPDCEATALQFDDETGLWSNTFELPAGDYEYKVALDGTWDRNYGANCEAGGADITLTLEDDQTVEFTYDHSTGCLTNSVTDDAPAPEPEPQTADIPEMVNIPGTIQPELGCDSEWNPGCEATALDYVENYDIWEGTFELPAGNYEYKVALNGGWDTNFGAFADPGGANIALNKAEDGSITFVYDHDTNWIADSVRHELVTAPGSYQDEIGCESEWSPECMISWLQDVDGDGIYTFSTDAIPAGEYETKAAIGRSLDVNYGADGEADGDNIAFTVPEDGTTVTFVYDSSITTMVISTGGGAVSGANLRDRRAYWVTEDTFAWDIEADADETYQLLYSPNGTMSVSLFGLDGDYETLDLSVNEDGLPEAVVQKFPHLAGYTAFTLDDTANVQDALRSQMAIAAYSGDSLSNLSGLQIPGVLDDLYTYTRDEGPLGAVFDENGVPSLYVWAPTAQDVTLNLYDDAAPSTEPEVYEMDYDTENGVWRITGDADWTGKYYTYTVQVFAPTEQAIVTTEVTDPYSVSLSQNSTRSQIIDLTSADLKPEGWDSLTKPELNAPEDITVYEIHMRDFSAFDETVPDDYRGTYMAFTQTDSDGMQHLQALAEAGLTHLHMLPSFDIATINENKDRWFQPDFDELATYGPASTEQQEAYQAIRDLDPFNWGYDPYHFNVPEGSYSTDPNGTTRVLEYREMVQAVNESGLRFVQDVVYNHTNASGQALRSVFDKVVPGYYHRLDASGRVTTSTCCQNTATEHNMMRRLMVDSIILHATEYKVDAFRFDLMGHHMLDDMLEVQEAVNSLTLDEDGVDGSTIYLYGEGWNFGEVADGARGVNATQFNAAGTGIGTFNDRLRDAVRGGSPFGGRDEQGLGNGVAVFPNDLNDVNQNEDRALLFADQTRIGLAGNLADYTFEDRNGETVTGQDIDYNGSPAGYTTDPQENVIYVSKHDNETLFDNLVYRIPREATLDDIVQMQNFSLSFVAYAQGIPFFHAGSDMLRSKSMDRDSYNSGDWFNRLDWTYQTNNFGVGLPPAWSNETQWDTMRPILERTDWQPGEEQILRNVEAFREMLQIRYSTSLFRLQTADQVQERVAFHNTGADQQPGVIVMSISDTVGDDLDPAHDGVVVVFNGTPDTLNYTVADLAGSAYTLHPVLADNGSDAAYEAETGTFTVPRFSTMVFVLPQN